tara:strand:+ start:81 stop:536 length:456 start_codon:yes stop_codon:yes gene_type:complete
MKTLLALLLLIPSLSWGNDELSGKNLICGLDALKSFVVIQFKKDRARVFTSKNANTEFWGIYDGSYKYETSLTEIITRYDRFSRVIIINRQNLLVDTTFIREDEKDDRTFMDGSCTVVDLERSINVIKEQKSDWKKYKTKKTKSLKEQQKI